MMRWFGLTPYAPVCLSADWAPTPIGFPCDYCDEPVAASDNGIIMDGGVVMHQECQVRMVVGSVACIRANHVGCGEGSGHADPPGMTKRQAARASMEAFGETVRREMTPPPRIIH
jgi:hypothetical protein